MKGLTKRVVVMAVSSAILAGGVVSAPGAAATANIAPVIPAGVSKVASGLSPIAALEYGGSHSQNNRPEQPSELVQRSAFAQPGVPAVRGLTLARAKQEIVRYRALTQARLRLLKREARSTSQKRIAAAAERQVRATAKQYRKLRLVQLRQVQLRHVTARGIWIPIAILVARLLWAAKSVVMGMLRTCMKATSCTGIVTKGAEKITATSVASAMVAGKKRTDCFWSPLSTIPFVKCLVIGAKK